MVDIHRSTTTIAERQSSRSPPQKHIDQRYRGKGDDQDKHGGVAQSRRHDSMRSTLYASQQHVCALLHQKVRSAIGAKMQTAVPRLSQSAQAKSPSLLVRITPVITTIIRYSVQSKNDGPHKLNMIVSIIPVLIVYSIFSTTRCTVYKPSSYMHAPIFPNKCRGCRSLSAPPFGS